MRYTVSRFRDSNFQFPNQDASRIDEDSMLDKAEQMVIEVDDKEMLASPRI